MTPATRNAMPNPPTPFQASSALQGLSFDDSLTRIRERLAHAKPHKLRGDRLQDLQGKALTPASVLVPLVYYPTHLSVLLTQRTDHLRKHPGQISFPGGRAESNDATPEATALRESQEEIGLSAEQVHLIGRLPNYITITGFDVTPVVGLLAPPLALMPDANEVAEAFEVPLQLFLHPENFIEHQYELDGRTGSYYAVNYQHRFIWGATAAMLLSLGESLTHQPFLEYQPE
jgi:8-oxo-dGTP pyrophosphatase MutT (NUDIX family)